MVWSLQLSQQERTKTLSRLNLSQSRASSLLRPSRPPEPLEGQKTHSTTAAKIRYALREPPRPCRENVVHMQFLCQQVIRSVLTQTWAALSPHSDHVEETWTSSLLPLHCDLLKLCCVSAAVDPVWGVALGPTDDWDSSVKCLRVHSHVELLQDALQKPWSPSELSALQQMKEHKVRPGLVNTEELLATEKTNVSVRTKRSAATRRQVQVKHADRADLHDREIRMQSKTKSGPEIPQK